MGKKANILVVDDTAFMRNIIKKMIIDAGHNVIGEANNGYEAINKYFELKPDIVTLDITMPLVDGITALKEIRSKDNNANIIVCSAIGQKFMILEAMEYGARDFLIKPFQSERITEAINKILEYNKLYKTNV